MYMHLIGNFDVNDEKKMLAIEFTFGQMFKHINQRKRSHKSRMKATNIIVIILYFSQSGFFVDNGTDYIFHFTTYFETVYKCQAC